MRIFISHNIGNDLELATIVQSKLKEEGVEGIIAQRKKEYELLIIEKIKGQINSSDYLIAIITRNGLASASVHEEIGFAIARKVPILLMVEKGMKEEGVLIHGKDTEYFEREQFAKHVDEIIRYVNKNGPRMKISDEEKKFLALNIYEPCYNALVSVYERTNFFLDEVPPNPWEKLTPAVKLKAEHEVRDMCQKYSEELEIWKHMYLEREKDFRHSQSEFVQIVREPFQRAGLLNTNGDITFSASETGSLADWLTLFRSVLFEPTIKDANNLFEKLSEYSRVTWKRHERTLKTFHEKTDLFRYLVKTLPRLRRAYVSEVSEEEFREQRETMRGLIKTLTMTLEEKLKNV